MNIQSIAKMLGIDSNVVNQVMEVGSKYEPSMNGLIQAINDNGGMAQVDKAMKQINNPLVKKGLSMAGIKTEEINQVYNMLKGNNANNVQNTTFNQNTSISYLDRLKRMKKL